MALGIDHADITFDGARLPVRSRAQDRVAPEIGTRTRVQAQRVQANRKEDTASRLTDISSRQRGGQCLERRVQERRMNLIGAGFVLDRRRQTQLTDRLTISPPELLEALKLTPYSRPCSWVSR
jgi:hypothetical protein